MRTKGDTIRDLISREFIVGAIVDHYLEVDIFRVGTPNISCIDIGVKYSRLVQVAYQISNWASLVIVISTRRVVINIQGVSS